jgi:hypothetical protein
VTTFLEKYPGGKFFSPENLGEFLQKIQFTGCILARTCKIYSQCLREISGDTKNPEILENFDKILEKKKILEILENFCKIFHKMQKVGNLGGFNPTKRQIHGCNQVYNT